MVPADSDRISRVPPYSGYSQFNYVIHVRDFQPLRFRFPNRFHLCNQTVRLSYNPIIAETNMVWAMTPFDRHYSGYRFFFLLLWVLRCFSSPRSPSITRVTLLQSAGLPHSDICGSILVCKSPQLFAAYHVLLRLRKPRHPLFALNYFL